MESKFKVSAPEENVVVMEGGKFPPSVSVLLHNPVNEKVDDIGLVPRREIFPILSV